MNQLQWKEQKAFQFNFSQNYILNITLHTWVQPSVKKNPVQNSFKPLYYHPTMKINSHLKKAITFFLFSNKIIAQNNHVLFPTIIDTLQP